MNQELESHFDEFDKAPVIRRKLLPWWIKIFCWFFMILTVCAVGALIMNIFIPTVNIAIYGFSSNTAFSGTGMFIIAIMLLKGFAAYSLWFEKPNAISIGKIDAICGVVICIAAMFALPFMNSNNFMFRLEILLLIPYYMRLNKIEYEWDNLEIL
ncbi:hypothetical protein [Flavobacterium piscisymbiosum]|uniref:Uncharacterized protein n=1 Tax=Flavobacterium piscisymbiosum TaxID=2893753 RepID=A0ABS8MG55_9FLAO|nr:hypothetical protein [Flavobacterium sp. F-30]MCC9064338.1 hypothetical protein [Flavobacterium sp. F-30]